MVITYTRRIPVLVGFNKSLKMIYLLAICSLITASFSQPVLEKSNSQSQEHMKFFLYENENGQIEVEHLVGVPINLTAFDSDIAYYYYSRSNPKEGIEIHGNNIKNIRNTAFDNKKDTLFIIHGWKNTKDSDVNSHIREYILRDHDVNVFVVDWSPVAGKSYVSAQGSVKTIGGFVADFIKTVSGQFGLNIRKLKFVGHSLGAHVAGCAGNALDGQIDRIVGLDPAGPLFSDTNTENRINPNSAKSVQIIHTNGGKLGYYGRLGDPDYYPNGGKSQPGCGVDITGTCSHSRAYAYYAESLTSNKFVSKHCSSYDDITAKSCKGKQSSMGMFNIDTSASGAYYLDINKESPFAKG